MMPEFGSRINEATVKPVSTITLATEEMLAQPYGDLGYRHETWNNVKGYKVNLNAVRSWATPPTTLDAFLAN